jgi:SMC interacting uncharacterized protein involved in chromosome segregation
MKNNQPSSDNKIMNMETTKTSTSVNVDLPPEKMSFDQLCGCMNRFFEDRDYESRQSFKKGFSSVVGEDYTNIDLLCNLNELVYNYCNTDSVSKAEKVNLKNICSGIQSVTKGLEQYNSSTQMDRILISTLMGYILKITRNYFHDRH